MRPGFLRIFGIFVGAMFVGGCAASSDDDLPTVVLETELGDIYVEVDIARAPLSAASFLAYVDAGLYSGAVFYRTVSPANDNGTPPISVIQGGVADESDEMPAVAHESTESTGIRHTDGVISLARSAPGTASGGAFFICIGDQPALDFGALRNPDGQGFAAFGRVFRGMEVARAIHGRDASGPSDSPYMQGQMLSEPVRIVGARRIER